MSGKTRILITKEYWNKNIAETMRGHGKGETTASLDRIDSKKAYEVVNV